MAFSDFRGCALLGVLVLFSASRVSLASLALQTWFALLAVPSCLLLLCSAPMSSLSFSWGRLLCLASPCLDIACLGLVSLAVLSSA